MTAAAATGRTIVFAGDSVTDCGRLDSPDGLGDGYVRELAGRRELASWRVLNRGVSGNRARDLVARWQDDVLAEEPDVVSVFVGINEVWRRFDSDDPTADARFEEEYRRLLDPLGGVRLVLVEPVLVPKDDEQRGWLDELAGKQHVVRELAREYGAVFVPAQQAMQDAGDAAAVAPDGVHPDAVGHRVLAQAWLAAAAPLLTV